MFKRKGFTRMGDRKIVLSISMLVSGRDDMFKSLESLKPFQEAFPCEVILVDTGCSEEQRDRAGKYADKILDFVWCKDFAAARNVGLNEATGEWFLYLDDDEWFDNPQQIIDFFQSGEYRRYKSAAYAVRNYLNLEGSRYETSYPVRMAQRTSELRFVGKIHEYLSPAGLPCKTFSDYVHHYGYVFANDEERKQHAARNIPPLLEMCSQYPGDPGWTAQLAQEYFGLEERNKVIETCQKGLEEWKACKDRVAYHPAHVGVLYSYILVCLELSGKYEEEEEWLTKALEDEVIQTADMQPAIAFYCIRGVIICNQFKKDESCRTFLKKYLNYEKKLREDAAAMERGAAAIVNTVFDNQNRYRVILTGLLALIRLGDYEYAEECFYMLDWNDDGLMGQEAWKKEFVENVCSAGYHPLLGRMLQVLADRKDGMREMYAVFQEVQSSLGQQGEKARLLNLYHIVSTLNNEHPYIVECSILWEEQNTAVWGEEECRRRIEDKFVQLFTKYTFSLLKIRPETWEVAERLNLSMESMFLQIDYRIWRRALEQWSLEAASEEFTKWNARVSTWKKKENIRYDFFYVKCEEGYLRSCQKSQITLEALEKLLWKYADDVIAMYEPYCKESVFCDAVEILPDEVQLAFYLKKIQESRRKGKEKETLQLAKNSISMYLPLETTINEYARMLRDEIQREIQEQNAERTELESLVSSLKSTARQLMEQGLLDAASAILCQVQACMPEDEEVRVLIQELSAR